MKTKLKIQIKNKNIEKLNNHLKSKHIVKKFYEETQHSSRTLKDFKETQYSSEKLKYFK